MVKLIEDLGAEIHELAFMIELEDLKKSELEQSIENNVFNFEAELNDTLDSNYDKIFMTNLDTRTEANDAFVSSEIINNPIIDNSFDIIEEPVKKEQKTEQPVAEENTSTENENDGKKNRWNILS